MNSNFAQESNTVHKTGNETVNGVKTFTGATYKNSLTAYENSGVSGYDYTPGSYKSVDTFIHRGVDHVYWGGLKHNWLSDGTSQTRFAVSNYRYINDTFNQGFWAVDLSASRDFLTVELVPSVNYGINLGSSTLQWNSLYAKTYYYNGTQWGLDQTNVWTNTNTFVGNIGLVTYKSNEIDRSQHTDSNYKFVTQVAQDKNGKKMGECYWGYKASTDEAVASFWVTASDGLDNDTKHRGGIYIFHNGSTGITDVHPAHLNGTNLGTSTNKWKTFNGLNPGALSLPNYSDTTYIDISGSIVPPSGETEINKNFGFNEYTPPIDGWLSIRCDGAQYLQIYRNAFNCPGVTAGDGTINIKLVVTLPVRKNETYTIRIKKEGAGIENYQLYPCLGNV